MLIGSQSTGQGHETAYARIVADRLGIPAGDVRVRQGDSDLVAHGSGTSGSRSLPTGGNAVLRAAEEACAKGSAVAAALLEAREEDVRFEGGRYRIAGTDRSAGFAEVVRASFDPALRPEAETLGLDAEVNHLARAVTFANGCHVCEVEIERATGAVRIVRYTTVDDFGRILKSAPDGGAEPRRRRARDRPGVDRACCLRRGERAAPRRLVHGLYAAARRRSAALRRPLRRDTVPHERAGREGCGEAGSIVSPPAVMNAVAHALRDHGGQDAVEMPATPEVDLAHSARAIAIPAK